MKTERLKGFTPTPICIVGEQRENMQKCVNRRISNFSALNKLVCGFTLAEILVVIAIVAVLIGLLMPALGQIKRIAKEAKQKAQITSIEIGIELYKNDFGSYPPSHGDAGGNYCTAVSDPNYCYCGAQTLAEAMFGWDFLGVHPNTAYRANGKDKDGFDTIYPLAPDSTNLNARKGPYLDRTNIDIFRPLDIFRQDTCSDNLEPNMYTICDVFAAVNRKIKLPGGTDRNYKVGTPVLYFRANISALNTQLIPTAGANKDNIYDYTDNCYLMGLKRIADGTEHPIAPVDTDPAGSYVDGSAFYDFITDPMVPTLKRPVRPDTFLLISAGYDGLYGTRDDICNFKPNIE